MIMDRNDLRRDWGPSALNATNQASFSVEYALPFGRDRRWLRSPSRLGDKLVSGWQVNGITTLLSGFPFTPLVGSNRSGDGDIRNPDRPSLNPSFSGPVVVGNPNQWFNASAFVLPAPGTFGNLGRGTFTGPGLANLDLSLAKSLAIAERMRLQFRAEAFNLLNHTNFGTPNTTVFSSKPDPQTGRPVPIVSPTAGLITATATFSRQIQFGLKLTF